MNSILERLLKLMLTILGAPDWADSESVRVFFRRCLVVLGMIAEKTQTPIDDAVVDGAERIVNDDASWAIAYSILADLFNFDADGELLKSDSRVVAVADKAGMDPATIIAILTTLWNVYKWWKDRQSS